MRAILGAVILYVTTVAYPTDFIPSPITRKFWSILGRMAAGWAVEQMIMPYFTKGAVWALGAKKMTFQGLLDIPSIQGSELGQRGVYLDAMTRQNQPTGLYTGSAASTGGVSHRYRDYRKGKFKGTFLSDS
jgi:hypothetical protein